MHKHRCVSWCVCIVQNPWFIFPQFYAFLTNCFAKSAHSFKVVFLIDRMTLWQDDSWWTTPLQSKKTVSKIFTFDRTWSAFSVLALLDASIGMILLWFQYHSHTHMIRHQLWRFWANLDFRWTSSTSPERCQRFIPKKFVKIACHEPNYRATSSAIFLIVIRRLSKNIFFTASTFSSVVDVFGRPERALSLTSSRPSLNWL